METKRSSPAVAKNREPLLPLLEFYCQGQHQRIFEVGSGTGEHGVFFGKKIPKVTWIFSDLPGRHQNIKAWIHDSEMTNWEGPYDFNFLDATLPVGDIDMIFTANTFHIAPWDEVKVGLRRFGNLVKKGALFLIYGPFNYSGQYTSESNGHFDAFLKGEDPKMGLRHFEEVRRVLEDHGWELLQDHGMPANNRLLVFNNLNGSHFTESSKS